MNWTGRQLIVLCTYIFKIFWNGKNFLCLICAFWPLGGSKKSFFFHLRQFYRNFTVALMNVNVDSIATFCICLSVSMQSSVTLYSFVTVCWFSIDTRTHAQAGVNATICLLCSLDQCDSFALLSLKFSLLHYWWTLQYFLSLWCTVNQAWCVCESYMQMKCPHSNNSLIKAQITLNVN